MKYFDVYYFCHLANSSIGKFEYARTYSDFFENFFLNKPTNFPENSFLNEFCNWFADSIVFEEVERIANEKEPYNFEPVSWLIQAIRKYKGMQISFREYDTKIDNDFHEFFNVFVEKLENEFLYSDIIECIANEMEYILFQNREFLLKLNEAISQYIENLGTVKRSAIPEWVKRTIFFRDRGCCVFCKKDLSGLLSVLEDREKHFDHIVPLDAGGINDVCNMQLSCRECNLSKATDIGTSSLYHSWH